MRKQSRAVDTNSMLNIRIILLSYQLSNMRTCSLADDKNLRKYLYYEIGKNIVIFFIINFTKSFFFFTSFLSMNQ